MSSTPTHIDVRTAAEFTSAHLPGSLNIPLPLFQELAPELALRLDGNAVLVCRSGARAEQARRQLAAAGLDGPTVLPGGLAAYEADGGKLLRGRQVWALERQVRLTAGGLVTLSLAAGRLVSPRFRLLAGGIGAGLTFSALSDTCAMGRALSFLPWNRGVEDPTRDGVLAQLPGSSAVRG